MKRIVCVFVIITIGYVLASPAEQCKGRNTEGLQERIHVDPCGKRKCKLIKGTNTTVTFRFKPKKDVKNLENYVLAIISPLLELPFIGVYGTSACNNIVHAEDNSPAQCPLQAGKEYLYENTFFIEKSYPPIAQFRVHWDLKDGDDSVICFEIPASIK